MRNLAYENGAKAQEEPEVSSAKALEEAVPRGTHYTRRERGKALIDCNIRGALSLRTKRGAGEEPKVSCAKALHSPSPSLSKTLPRTTANGGSGSSEGRTGCQSARAPSKHRELT